MHIDEELQRIREVGERAYALVEEGRFRTARNIIKRLKSSCCVSESEAVMAIIEAKILQGSDDQKGARQRILDSMGYLWGVADGFEIIAASNPLIDSASSQFYIEILGGLATLGMFTQFSGRHIASFDVIANSVDEALVYIEEVSHFADPAAKMVLNCAPHPLPAGSSGYRGVIKAYPFRLYEEQ